uniref:Ribonuclease Oy n=1 Tax=Caligus rogercresseyi TaxID=217165 RepID=C1BPJ6_CALRO|nr:Ribonuclease Oy [Caligus rogercresseyi]
MIFLFLICGLSLSGPGVSAKAHYSDHIILSHRWPVSECTEWMQSNVTPACNIPPVNDWIVGGFWPYRLNAEQPTYCNKSIHADEKVLIALTPELLRHWPSIRKKTANTTHWREEYLAHGSCAYTLPLFNSTAKYFNGTLHRLAEHNITDILAKANIIPGYYYSVNRILHAVQSALKDIQPGMRCITHKATKGLMLRDIYTCYDTEDGSLINCEELKGGLFAGCSQSIDKELIYYPSMEYPLPHKFSRALIAFLIILFGTLNFIGAFFGYKKYLEFRERRGYNSVS